MDKRTLGALAAALLLSSCVKSESILEPVDGPRLVYSHSIPGAGSRSVISPAGTHLASIDAEGRVVVVDIAKRSITHTLVNYGITDDYLTVVFSPDGRQVVASGERRQEPFASGYVPIDFRDVGTGSIVRTVEYDRNLEIHTIAISPDARSLAVGSYNYLDVLDAQNGRRKASFPMYDPSRFSEILFVSSTRLIAHDRRKFNFDDVEWNGPVIAGHNRWRLTPDARRIISVGDVDASTVGTGGYVAIASMETSAQLGELPIDEQHVTGLAVSPDGEYFVVGGEQLEIFRVRDGGWVGRFAVEGGKAARDIHFTSDGTRVIIAAGGSYLVYSFER